MKALVDGRPVPVEYHEDARVLWVGDTKIKVCRGLRVFVDKVKRFSPQRRVVVYHGGVDGFTFFSSKADVDFLLKRIGLGRGFELDTYWIGALDKPGSPVHY